MKWLAGKGNLKELSFQDQSSLVRLPVTKFVGHQRVCVGDSSGGVGRGALADTKENLPRSLYSDLPASCQQLQPVFSAVPHLPGLRQAATPFMNGLWDEQCVGD